MLKTLHLTGPFGSSRELRERWLGGDDLSAYSDIERPKTRDECLGGPRPCPLVGCRYNNFLDVSERSGSIKFNHPDREPWDVPPSESCALDVADAHPSGAPLPVVAEALALSYDRTWQVIDEARRRARVIADEMAEEEEKEST